MPRTRGGTVTVTPTSCSTPQLFNDPIIGGRRGPFWCLHRSVEIRDNILYQRQTNTTPKHLIKPTHSTLTPPPQTRFMPPKRKSIETLRADASAKNREADIVHLLQFVPPLIIGPFFWGLKCLITIFFGSLILNTADTFCTAPLNTFVTLQLTFSYIFLFMWGWIIIGPIPCKSTKPIMIMYGIYVFTQFIVGILGTVWYNMGRLECSESVPELTKMSLFEVVTFWLTCEWCF